MNLILMRHVHDSEEIAWMIPLPTPSPDCIGPNAWLPSAKGAFWTDFDLLWMCPRWGELDGVKT